MELDINAEERSLYVFPFPAFLLFAAQQLDVLHTVDELHQIILIDGHLFKVLPVQVGPLAHEQLYPTHIGCAEQNENEEYFPAVYGQYDTEDDYREGREQNIEHGLGEELSMRLWSSMRRIKSPASLLSKNLMGSRISLERKSEMSDTLTRVLMWSSIQRRITSISVRLNTSMSCAAKMSCIKFRFLCLCLGLQ